MTSTTPPHGSATSPDQTSKADASPLLIATGNPHKVDEIRAVLDGLGIACEGLGDLDAEYPEPDEDGETFEANARIKATAYARATGRVCLADDSGLEIDALDGRPGVHSARYAADRLAQDADRAHRDGANNAKVIEELTGVPSERRTARFVCVLCVASPEGEILAEVRGDFEGRIGEPAVDSIPRGTNGFGYDPLFLVAPAYERTSAELEPSEKNRISHRGSALVLLAEKIEAGALDRLREG